MAKKKCSCGCDIIKHKEGGKIIEKCACGCKASKLQEGNIVEKEEKGTKISPKIMNKVVEMKAISAKLKCGSKVKKKEIGGTVKKSFLNKTSKLTKKLKK